jgi:predicted transcriptional regulator
MIAILSIKPKYIDEILKGNKKYEFRKSAFRKNVETVIVYATKPVGKIVCKFNVGKVIESRPEELWENFGDVSALTKEEFFAYFNGRKKGVAIEIMEVERLSEPIEPKEIYADFTPPQSWIYVSIGEDPLKSRC